MKEWNHVFERLQRQKDRGKIHPLTKNLRITEWTIYSILTYNETMYCESELFEP